MKPFTKPPVWKLRETENRPLTADQVFAQVGATLFALHQLERTMKLCAALFQSAATSVEDDVVDKFWKMRRSTCGAVVNALQKLLEIEPDFERVLLRLIRRRNALSHKLFVHTPFNPASASWLLNVQRFLWAMQVDLMTVDDIFRSYFKACLGDIEANPLRSLSEPIVSPFLGFKPATGNGKNKK